MPGQDHEGGADEVDAEVEENNNLASASDEADFARAHKIGAVRVRGRGRGRGQGRGSGRGHATGPGPAAVLSAPMQHVCPLCQKELSSASSLQYHLEKRVCTIRAVINAVAIDKISPLVEEADLHQCPQCLKIFKSKGAIRYHTENAVCSSARASEVGSPNTHPPTHPPSHPHSRQN